MFTVCDPPPMKHAAGEASLVVMTANIGHPDDSYTSITNPVHVTSCKGRCIPQHPIQYQVEGEKLML